MMFTLVGGTASPSELINVLNVFTCVASFQNDVSLGDTNASCTGLPNVLRDFKCVVTCKCL